MTDANRWRPRGTNAGDKARVRARSSVGGIDGLAFDDEGKLYVFDGISLRIVVVGLDGGFVQVVGRKGDGPGELRSAAGVRFAVLGNGRVVVYEMFPRAFQVYGPTGDFERMVPMGAGALVGIPGLQATADGGVISTGVVDRGRRGEEAGSPSSGTRGFVERFVLEGEEAASEAWEEADEFDVPVVVVRRLPAELRTGR